MTIGIVGRKCGMSRVFTENGESVPVSVIEVEANRVTQVKTRDNDGYDAIQVTTSSKRAALVSKPKAGHFAKAKTGAGRGLWEFRLNADDGGKYQLGAESTADVVFNELLAVVRRLGRPVSEVCRRFEPVPQILKNVRVAGPTRLDAAAAAGVPQVVGPGCLDMANFGPRASVPPQHQGRLLYEWNPTVTLMRTTAEENALLGRIFAEKLNAARGPTRVLIPLRGFSMLDSPGERFWSPEADAAFVAALRADLRPDIPVEQLDANINDPAFADRAAAALLEMLGR